MPWRSIDPATGHLLKEYPETAPGEALEAAVRADAAHRTWREIPVAERAASLRRIAESLRTDLESHARLVTAEMGKPIPQARAEIEKCARGCDFYAGHAAAYLASEEIETEASRSLVVHEPLGTVLAIMPWNFPFWQAVRFAAPAIAAGNAVVLKHAPNVPGCAEAIARAFGGPGLPDGLFVSVRLDVAHVPNLIAHPSIRAVTFTGSTRAGSAIAAEAGRHLKKTVLELGGSDPYVILEDADIPRAAKSCVESRLVNSGQSCIAAKRFVVVDKVREAFEEAVLALLRSKRTGDPADEATEIGPLARADLRDTLHDQVCSSIDAGALLQLGGELPDGPGFFYPPTLLTNVRPGMPAFDEETFGPVAAVVPAADEREAIRLANASPYGLGAAVFTADAERGERLARAAIEAGSCFVNAAVHSDPRLPFGGIKRSGYGRELGRHGLLEFINIKTVSVD